VKQLLDGGEIVAAVGAGREQRRVFRLAEIDFGAKVLAELGAAIVAGTVDATAEDGVALQTPTLVLEPVLRSALRAVNLHLGLPPLC